MKNIGYTDKLIRVILVIVLAMTAYFWVGGVWGIVLYVFSAILLFTVLTSYCALYQILGVNTRSNKKPKIWVNIIFSLIVLILLIGGSYGSNFFTKKIFLEDFNYMNAPYKQTLFETGQNNRVAAIGNYTLLIQRLSYFKDKYSSYHPYILKGDSKFDSDINEVFNIVSGIDQEIREGNLTKVHLKLENVRPILNDILKRNDLSMLSVSLVDFHDSMEIVLDAANAKDKDAVLNSYIDADAKLKDVENELNDESIKAIRNSLEMVKKSAEEGNIEVLPNQASTLKSNFVKVYLKLG